MDHTSSLTNNTTTMAMRVQRGEFFPVGNVLTKRQEMQCRIDPIYIAQSVEWNQLL